ncbi:MAG: carotenoid biosynthesis protein [Sphingobacteriaceae bacterium]
MKQKKHLLIFLVILFHAVGFFGFFLSYNELFTRLIPFHLLLMLLLLVWAYDSFNYRFSLLIYCLGFGIEYVGVHTGLIFGRYEYGAALGVKLASIPLLIGVNWVLLIFSAGSLIQYLSLKSDVLKSALAAALLVLLDAFIEPVAIRFDYWHWISGSIPLQNYIAWFLFSFVCFLLFFSRKIAPKNPVALTLFLAQFLFFIALNYWS